MTPKTFLQNFAHLAATPNGPQKLRELVLQLAVQGRLVPQDPNDEPAQVLLERIRAEKERLVAKGKTKKTKTKSQISEGEEKFDLPHGWTWVSLGALGATQTGTTPPKNRSEFFGDYIPFVKPADISHSSINYEGEALSKDGLRAGRHIPVGSVLMVCIGGSIGKANMTTIDVSCNQQINTVTPYLPLGAKFLLYAMRSSYWQSEVVNRAAHGTLPIISKSKWEAIPIPLPPLAEQKRIVAKVDELMALIDDLEARQEERKQVRIRLNDAALHRLTTADTPKTVAQNWQPMKDHFDILYNTPDTVPALRQAILQLAVQGKLVPQDPNDEPAEVLLEQIQEEKERLVKEGRIRRRKGAPPTEGDGPIAAVPSGWVWSRLGELCFEVADGPHFSPKYVTKEDGIPFLSTRNVKIDGFALDSVKYVSPEDHREFCKRVKPEMGDILYTKGGTTGIARVNDLDFPFSVWVHVAVLKVAKNILDPLYIALALNAPHCYLQSQKYTHGSSNNDLGLTRMVHITVPLPPVAEQKRIVVKVDEIMALCDALEARLTQAQDDGKRLVEAAVHALLVA